MDSAKIYINGELLGYCKDPESFTNEMREKRRNGEVSHEMNITYYDKNNEIGQLNTGDPVELIEKEDSTYWYVFVPKLGKEGYVDKNYLK